MEKVFIITILIFPLLFSFSCNNTPTDNSENDDQIQLNYSYEDSVEAFNLALWFEGNLLPSDSTVQSFLFNINYLRYVYSDSFSILNENRFKAPWKIGEIAVKFDDSTASLVNQNQYDGWNFLDSSLRPDSILEYPDILGWALLGFNEPYNPLKLSTFYRNLSGVKYSEPNGITFAGGTFPIFPGIAGREISYIFVGNYSILPNKYFYFKYMNNKPLFVGVYYNGIQEKPDWWEEAKINIEQFISWQGP